jgi:hypothetical protein
MNLAMNRRNLLKELEIMTVSKLLICKSKAEQEEHFILYVKTKFEAVYIILKRKTLVNLIIVTFFPRSIKLRDLEEEMITHVADVIGKLDADIFDDVQFHV